MSEMYEIIEILELLIAEHEKMLKLARQKKEILITGAIDDLARILQFESRSINAIQSLELEREKHISLYLMRRGIRKETCYISDLIEMAGDTEAKKSLVRCQNVLGNMLKELKDANQLNQQLIEQSLAFVNHSLEELTAPPEDPYTYKKTTAGPVNPYTKATKSYFDSKA
ncbi:flagellar protein FlgN [Aneurinibacillus tyrosinisolvens]|uniref:flagellar protein FlgN n=1 Tax=Aneurinibacillus tyrosinisolvens TaxID=1443435 RepID=UPI00063ED45D|nr:flagellar protein FlgN [Aneurinibacillus tyrosinisolvens]